MAMAATEAAKSDWARKLTDHLGALFKVLLDSIRPPSEVPIWKWLEEFCELDPATSQFGGPVSFDLFPASKIFFTHAQNSRTRRITVMVSHQSGKTENAIMLVLWSVLEKPMPTMWVMAAADQCEEFAKDRLYPAFQNCKPVFAVCPRERKFWTKRMLKLPTMTLHLRGSNSRAKLQSSPVGRIILDERREYRPGAVHLVRNRTTTFTGSQEISMGVAGRKGDELHTDWEDGSQGFIHFHCLKCNHSQPFRFGTKASVLFPEARACGGLVWETNDTTKPDGEWNYQEVEKAVRYQCENPECKAEFQNSEKIKLLGTVHEFHRNPSALPEHPSLHWNTLMMPWPRCDWGKIAVRFLKAKQAFKRGDIEPLYTVITEDFGEPFALPDRTERVDLQDRKGNYKLGEYWMDPKDPTKMDPNTVAIMTFDRQQFYVRYIVRQWRRNGESRLVHFGSEPSLDALRDLQLKLGLKDRWVWGDDGGPSVAEFRQKAFRWGWNIMKGEDRAHYTIHVRQGGVDKSVRQSWQKTEFDPGIGTTRQGRATMAAYLWSNPAAKDKLYWFCIRGLGPLWEIPQDVPPEYITELNGNEWQDEDKATGAKEGFEEVGPDHAADAELMSLIVADIGGLSRVLANPT